MATEEGELVQNKTSSDSKTPQTPSLVQEIKSLLWKDFTLEWRNKYALNGILLYLASTIFIVYLSFSVKRNQLNPITWNALFWIIILFTGVNAVAKSFFQEKQERLYYYYMMFSASAIIISKIIYNFFLMLTLSIAGLLTYAIVLGNPISQPWFFLMILMLGSLGISATFSMISAIASKTGNNMTLMAVLGFPVILPILLMLIRMSKNAIDGLAISTNFDEILTLLAVDAIVITTASILFPFLWRS